MNKIDGNEKWRNHVNECDRLVRGISALARACVEKGSVNSEFILKYEERQGKKGRTERRKREFVYKPG